MSGMRTSINILAKDRQDRMTLPHFLSFIIPVCSVLLLVFCGTVAAQDVDLDASVTSDDNIFDTFSPVSDVISQLQADVSQSWDYDQVTIGGEYTGAVLLFRDLPARNFHMHTLALTGIWRFESTDSIDTDENDSGDGDSVSVVHPPLPPVPDSLCHFMETRISGSAQFDREAYAVYNAAGVAGTAALREPMGMMFSLRPIYGFAFHYYPRLTGLGNIQNSAGLRAGTSWIPGGWLSASVTFSVKSYPSAATVELAYLADTTIVEHTHGKPVITQQQVERTKTIDLNSPSVKQFSADFNWKQRFGPGTTLTFTAEYFGIPSTAARVIPELEHGAAESGTSFAGQGNEIFDDHFSFHGGEIQVQVDQHLPAGFLLSVAAGYERRDYLYPATDQADSLLPYNRRDTRAAFDCTISRPLDFGSGKLLVPRVEIHHTGNVSNAPYYEYTRNSIVAGIEWSF
jgi:hypothetical protein